MIPGTDATPRMSLFWYVQKVRPRGRSGVIHRGVLESGAFVTSCGRWFDAADVQVEPTFGVVFPDSMNRCLRCYG